MRRTEFIIAVVIFLMPFMKLRAQMFSLDNPNITFKSKSGVTLTKDSVGKILAAGPFDMMQKNLTDGKMEITIFPSGTDGVNKMKAAQDALAAQLRGKKLPQFKLTGLQGAPVNSSDLAGKWIVVNFWFVGCKPCVAEIPELNKVAISFRSKDAEINFIAPALDDENTLKKFLRKHTFEYQVTANASEFAKSLKISSYPTHLIVDKNGIIQEVLVGTTSNIGETLTSLIQRIAHLEPSAFSR